MSQRFRANLQKLLEILAQDITPDASVQALLELATLMRSVPVVRQMVVAEQYVMPMVDAIRTTAHISANAELLGFLYEVLDIEGSEQLALVGGLRALIDLANEAPSKRSRSLAAINILKMISLSDSVTRMFLACDGLACINRWLDSRYADNRSLIRVATDCLAAILDFKGATSSVRKAILARLVKGGVLETLTQLLHRFAVDRDSESNKYTQKLLDLLVAFSSGEATIREQMAEAAVLSCLLLPTLKTEPRNANFYYAADLVREIEYLPPMLCVTAAKVIKNISTINSTLDALWRLDCVSKLVDLLRRSEGPCAKVRSRPSTKPSRSHTILPPSQEICNQVLPALFNLCRIDKSRQEAAAAAGVIPVLQQVVRTAGPTKEFAFSILTDLAHAGRRSRELLLQHDGLEMYIAMLSVSGHEVNALESTVALWVSLRCGQKPERCLNDRLFFKGDN